jgi:hypothetical protein
MGFVVNPIQGTVETFTFPLRGSDIVTMGSTPIALNFTTGVLNQWFYIPINAFLLRTGGVTLFDFGISDHPIITGTGPRIFQWEKPIQDYSNSNEVSFALPIQHIQSNLTYARDPSYKIGFPWHFTTSTGNDATVGDLDFNLIINVLKYTY